MLQDQHVELVKLGPGQPCYGQGQLSEFIVVKGGHGKARRVVCSQWYSTACNGLTRRVDGVDVIKYICDNISTTVVHSW